MRHLLRFLGVAVIFFGLHVPVTRGLAQTPGKIYRIAVVSPSEDSYKNFRGFTLPELAKAGFLEGRNLVVTDHSGPADRVADLAREAIATRPDLVIASGEISILAVTRADPRMPVVMAFMGGDPVTLGLAQSLGRPGGNITGITILATELDGKRASLLNETVPTARRVAVLMAGRARHAAKLVEVKRVAQILGFEVLEFDITVSTDYATAFAAMRTARAEALLIISAPEFFRDATQLAQLAIDAKLPTMCEWASMARDGCLIGYGPNFSALYARASDHIVRVLRGTPPGEIPIEQPTVFDFAVNLQTAKAIGTTVPPALILRANEVID